MDASCKKSLHMTSYGGIIRIRLKGRSLMTSSQPAHELPCFVGTIIHLRRGNFKNRFEISSAR